MSEALAKAICASPRLKVERAQGHIEELRRLTTPLDRAFYDLSVIDTHGMMFDEYTKCFDLTYRPKKPIPELASLIIGDAVHNLRAAMDHLACNILREAGSYTTRSGFPFHEERENLIRSDKSFASIKEAVAGSDVAILDEVKPFNSGNHLLWVLNKLDRIDKHNTILATVTVTQIANVNLRTGTNYAKNMSATFDAGKPFIIARSNLPTTINSDFNAAVSVKFGDGTFLKDDPVIPALTQMSQFVTEAINCFDRLIRANGVTKAA